MNLFHTNQKFKKKFKIFLLFICLINFNVSFDGFPHHGIFSHENHGRSPKGHTNLLHLFRADIVCPNNKAFRIFIQQLLKIIFKKTENLKNKERVICNVLAITSHHFHFNLSKIHDSYD